MSTVTPASLFRGTLRALCWLVILAPAIFFVLVVQRSAIIFPFWDHCEFVQYFAKLYDGTLTAHDLLAPHNHSRPLVLRALILLNGAITNWDISSEYVYLETSLIIGFVVQALCLRRLCGGWTLRCLALVAALSIFSFSPAAHNNHWWSFMLQLTLTHLLVVSGFVFLCWAPRTWRSNVVAALAFWLATYTLSNGLVAFLTAAITVHIARRPLFRFDRFTLFWLVNTAAITLLYLPGLAETASSYNLGKLLDFSLAYLGSPVATLFAFPYRNMFDIPPVTLRNGIFGAILIFIAVLAFLSLKRRLAAASPSSLLFVAFSVFALGSAILTGTGRAEFDAVGIANANASRYTIFAVYLVYALLYAAADMRLADLPGWFQTRRNTFLAKGVAIVCGIVFLCFATRSYAKSVSIYNEAHEFNQLLASAFWSNNQDNQKDVYPNADRVKEMILDLKRLRIGPYRFDHPDDRDDTSVLAAHKMLDQFGVNGLRNIPELGQILFANPASRFQMQVSPVAKSVHFSFGIADNAVQATPTLAGVEFRVLLKGPNSGEKLLWSSKLQPVSAPMDRGVQRAQVPLVMTEDSQLIFETKAIADPQGCWAFWRNVETTN